MNNTDLVSAKDLIVLVPCKNMEFAVDGLLSRPESLGIRKIDIKIYPHPERDSGVLLRAHDFLRPFIRDYKFALVMFDKEGCGREHILKEALEGEVESRLNVSGWNGRARAIVIEPELEMWVWSNSPHVESILGWSGKETRLRTWLQNEGFCGVGEAKPQRPKEAVEKALRISRKARSSSIYKQLAQKVSLDGCVDPSFNKFRATLQSWFGSN